MNRFARVMVTATMACVMTVAAVSVSSADTGKRGTGSLTPGAMRPVSEFAVQGSKGDFFGQFFDYSRFFGYLFLYYKFGFKL
jgi:hypothetical protein